MPVRQPQPSVTYLDTQEMYLISVPRGVHGQRRRRVALTRKEAQLILGMLVGEMKNNGDLYR